jgi:hypothetical protein
MAVPFICLPLVTWCNGTRWFQFFQDTEGDGYVEVVEHVTAGGVRVVYVAPPEVLNA